MKKINCVALMFLLVGTANYSFATKITEQEKIMYAKGKFEVSLSPQKDEEAPAGRMIINKSYQGDIEGTGVGQMISKRIEGGREFSLIAC